jgi:hypothetical protein
MFLSPAQCNTLTSNEIVRDGLRPGAVWHMNCITENIEISKWIKNLHQNGSLTVGFGQLPDRFGPELEFGYVVGDHFNEQVTSCVQSPDLPTCF